MGSKILVVNDEIEIADMVEFYLQNDGFELCNKTFLAIGTRSACKRKYKTI